jgi:hypothetical protein
MDVNRDGELYRVTTSQETQAPPEVVYEVLADLNSHVEWGGSWHPSRTQRLQSMDAPQGLATVGVEFWSIGATNKGSWHDHSRVIAAEPPSVFEFVTDGVLLDQGAERMFLNAIHRYEIAPQGTGSMINYFLVAKLTVQSPPGDEHPRLPAVIFNLILPAVIERGMRNLGIMAERQIGVVRLAPAVPPSRGVARRRA